MLGLNPKTSSFGINNQITSHSHSIHIHWNSIHNQSQLFTRQSKYMPHVHPNKSQTHRHKNMKNKHGTSLLFPTTSHSGSGQQTATHPHPPCMSEVGISASHSSAALSSASCHPTGTAQSNAGTTNPHIRSL